MDICLIYSHSISCQSLKSIRYRRRERTRNYKKHGTPSNLLKLYIYVQIPLVIQNNIMELSLYSLITSNNLEHSTQYEIRCNIIFDFIHAYVI